MSGKLAHAAVPLVVTLTLAHATAARAGDEDAPSDYPAAAEGPPGEISADPGPPQTPRAGGDASPGAADYYPPPVDGPALRLPEPQTRIYVDAAYAISDDLTALPYIAGTGRNFRLALGGAWRWRRFAFEAQLPANLTTLHVTQILNGVQPVPEDRDQTQPSLGDLTLGAIWTERFTDSEAVIGGLGVRGRFPTHTTRFEFHIDPYTVADFVTPYYFHIEPTLILGGALGPFTYVMNQGAIVMLGPDGDFYDAHITVPTVYLYDAHYAVGVAPWSVLGASVELATTIQLNHVAGTDFEKFNHIRAVWVAPALQIHAADWRIDLIARLGLSRGQELFGVLEYVGTHSFTLRVTRAFN